MFPGAVPTMLSLEEGTGTSDGFMTEISFAAWVGLDWADQHHVICLYEVATVPRPAIS